MTDALVSYQGRNVTRDGFRVFVFGLDGANKLVNSYEEYEKSLENGWYSTEQEVPVKKMVQVDSASITDLVIDKKGHKTRRG